MSDYIKREDAKSEIRKRFQNLCDRVEVNSVLNEVPSADVRENVKGKWVAQNPMVDTLECSVCGYNIISEELITPFCPWRGADMRKTEVVHSSAGDKELPEGVFEQIYNDAAE